MTLAGSSPKLATVPGAYLEPDASNFALYTVTVTAFELASLQTPLLQWRGTPLLNPFAFRQSGASSTCNKVTLSVDDCQ
jgi:hypothetical protein